uniref:Uncharacterized protein n=1 Tax=Davidia involucrata TaxID=16924 RepID=A0A5B6ZB77_DAVIN
MSTIAIHGPGIPRNSCYGTRIHHKFQRISASWTMKMNSNSSQTRKREELSIELQKHTIPQLETASHSSLQFDRLQPSEQELIQENRLEFGQFVSREAVLDEEFWVGNILLKCMIKEHKLYVFLLANDLWWWWFCSVFLVDSSMAASRESVGESNERTIC